MPSVNKAVPKSALSEQRPISSVVGGLAEKENIHVNLKQSPVAWFTRARLIPSLFAPISQDFFPKFDSDKIYQENLQWRLLHHHPFGRALSIMCS
ncbi:hypothetical protein L1887_34130 [Cichorium endivia]|nr:hypothetical protein L1887_34130 [Cichorium endivia]